MNQREDWMQQIQRYAEGQLDTAEMAALSAALRQDSTLRRDFLELLNLDSALDEMVTADDSGEALLAADIAGLQAEADSIAGKTTAPTAVDGPLPLPPAGHDLPSPAGRTRQDGKGAGGEGKSPVLGFLGDLGRQGWGYVSGHAMLFSVLAAVLIAAIVTVWDSGFGRRTPEGGSEITINSPLLPAVPGRMGDGQGANSPLPPGEGGHHVPMVGVRAAPTAVAQLIRTAGCRWADADSEHGDRLVVGQSLHLASGVAEIHFDVGVKVVLQAPASFQIQSAKSARLDRGKLAASITSDAAHGFRIDTPEAVYTDQGTEFGVEVSPGGASRACVFKGRVDVAAKGQGSAARELTADQGVRVEDDGQDMTFIEDRGESFIRSLDEADRDRHTVAWWRFEDRPLGTAVPHTERNKNPVRATTDSSFNGNDLFAWNPKLPPRISGEVQSGAVPQTGAANRGCLDTTELQSRPGMSPNHSDLYTKSRFSHAAPLDAQASAPAQWTIEVSVKAKSLGGTLQTFVGRDGCDRYSSEGPGWIPPRLAFQITKGSRFAIRFVDCDNRAHEAVGDKMPLEAGHWYNLAATSDGRTLRLYVDAIDGKGYGLQAQTALPNTGSTALGSGSNDAEWSIGRGRDQATGKPGEWFEGWIDEVRISDLALDPREFLFCEVGGRRTAERGGMGLRPARREPKAVLASEH